MVEPSSATLKEFATTTTAHGVNRIVSSKNVCLKVFWVLTCLTALGVCVSQIVVLTQYYLSYPTTMESKVGVRVYTICV